MCCDTMKARIESRSAALDVDALPLGQPGGMLWEPAMAIQRASQCVRQVTQDIFTARPRQSQKKVFDLLVLLS